jgi:uncharacterized integral membrane protein
LTNVTRSTGNVVRKVVAAIILVPLAVVIIAFAVANRQIVTVSLDPFSSEHPAASLTLPLFALVVVLLVVGVLIGGIAAWLRQARWRRTARRLEREVADFRLEIEGLKQTGGGFPGPGGTAGPTGSERLQLRPPPR